MARYKNCFWRRNPVGAGKHVKREYDQEFFETDKEPVQYAGLLIYKREESGNHTYDVVVNGFCVAQRGEMDEAQKFAELIGEGLKVSC